FGVARALVYGFDLPPADALRLLLRHCNPRCVPPWSEGELRHKVEDADRIPFGTPRGYLRDEPPVGQQSQTITDSASGNCAAGGGRDLTVTAEPNGRTKCKVVVRSADIPVCVETVNLATSTGRKTIIDAVVAKFPGSIATSLTPTC